MSRRTVALAGGAVLALAASWIACGDPYGADAAPPPGGPDAAADGPEEAGVEAAAGPDAHVGPDADGGPCTHVFCADFETSAVAEWDGQNLLGGGTLGREVGAMGAGKLRAQIPAAGDGVGASAYVVKAFSNVHGIHVEVAVNIAPTQLTIAGSSFSFLEITAGATDPGVSVYIVPLAPNLSLYLKPGGGGTNQNVSAMVGVPEGQWVQIAVDAAFDTNATVHVEVDQKLALDKVFASAAPTKPLQLRLGLQRYNQATPALSVAYDAVRVDLRP